MILSLGQSIWQLVHLLPLFSSQHLPARLLFLAILLLALVLAAAADAPWARFARAGAAGPRRAALAVVTPLRHRSGHRRPPGDRGAVPPRGPARHAAAPSSSRRSLQHYVYGKPAVGPALRDRYEWPAKIIYPSMLANTGMVTCYGIPPEATHSPVVGSDQPEYRGLVFLASGAGRAEVTRWTPNAVTVRVTGAAAGDRLVYDMNADSRLARRRGAPVESWQGLVAVPLRAGDQTIELPTARPA